MKYIIERIKFPNHLSVKKNGEEILRIKCPVLDFRGRFNLKSENGLDIRLVDKGFLFKRCISVYVNEVMEEKFKFTFLGAKSSRYRLSYKGLLSSHGENICNFSKGESDWKGIGVVYSWDISNQKHEIASIAYCLAKIHQDARRSAPA